MSPAESAIIGSDKLIGIFGYWPSFHDAEVLELHFWRGHVDTTKGIYDFPVLTAKVHLWELTKEVKPDGNLLLRHHTLTTIKFRDVSDFHMDGFNHQNAILSLSIRLLERTEKPSPYFSIEFAPAFGMGASFICLAIQVVDAVACKDDGGTLP